MSGLASLHCLLSYVQGEGVKHTQTSVGQDAQKLLLFTVGLFEHTTPLPSRLSLTVFCRRLCIQVLSRWLGCKSSSKTEKKSAF